MERELRYSQILIIPLHVTYADLIEKCKEKNITFDKTKKTKVCIFYTKSISDMRWIIFIFSLKITNFSDESNDSAE